MKKDSNFKKALNELLNPDKNDADQVFESQKGADSISGQTEEEKAQTDQAQGYPFPEASYTEKSAAEEPDRREARPVSEPPVPYNGEHDALNKVRLKYRQSK